MDCKEARILFAHHIKGDSEPGPGLYSQLEDHLRNCQTCRNKYESCKETISIERHMAILAKILSPQEKKKAAEKEEIELSWKRTEARLDKLKVQERKEKRSQSHKLLFPIAAASLIIGIVGLIFPSKPEIVPRPSVKIELVSKNGRIPIPANQRIASTDELQTLIIINDKHHLTMNTNTVLVVEPLVIHSNIGCLVKLDSGQIYTHVQHDRNPFVVDTVHGKAIITGTIFDVKVTDDNTILVVCEGTVQFESDDLSDNISTKYGLKGHFYSFSLPIS